MMHKERALWILLGLLITATVLLKIATPAPLDWTENFSRDDDRPFGARVLFDVLPELLPGVQITPVERAPFEEPADTAEARRTYFFLTDTFAPDPAETKRLLRFSARGGTVFIAASTVAGALVDSMHLEAKSRSLGNLFMESTAQDTVGVNLSAPTLRADEFLHFRPGMNQHYVSGFDTLRTTVLGEDEKGEVNFVRFAYGEGALFVNVLPLLFTNYNLLTDDGATYVTGALSYVPAGELLWDSYYKPLRMAASTPLRFILLDPPLRWSYFLLIGTVLAFIIIRSRRRQRPIPIVSPLRNTTVDFVETVGRLYYLRGDHADLAAKKIAYFLNYLRTRYHVSNGPAVAGFVDHVSDRTGVSKVDVTALFEAISEVRANTTLTEKTLLRLNTRIEDFYRKCGDAG